MDLLPVIQQHLSRYPAMTAQDCAKLIYQAVLGPAHLGRMGNPPPSYIINEMLTSPKRDLPLTESIVVKCFAIAKREIICYRIL